MSNFPNNKKWNGYNKITNQFNQEPNIEVSKVVDLIISYYIFLGLAKNIVNKEMIIVLFMYF